MLWVHVSGEYAVVYIKGLVYYLQNDIVLHMTSLYENNDIHMYV